MSQTVPYQVVVNTELAPTQPFEHLYTHVKQRDPKLFETIAKLALPGTVNNTLNNPLQALNLVFLAPTPGMKTNWANIISNVPDDESNYFPIIVNANVDAASSTDVTIDIQVSHDGGVNFISILNGPVTIPATTTGPIQVLTFAQGSYFRNLDVVYGQLTSAAFDGGNITVTLLFQ